MSVVHLRVVAGGEHYALPVSNVLGITPLVDVTPVPGSLPELLGVLNLRGQVVPLVYLAAVLGLTDAGPRWTVLSESEGRRCALAVHETLDVGELEAAEDEVGSPFLDGARIVDGELVGVVDVAAVIDAVSSAAPA